MISKLGNKGFSHTLPCEPNDDIDELIFVDEPGTEKDEEV